MATPELGSNAAEQLNNAIVALGMVAPSNDAETQTLITEWLAFWGGPKRALLPEPMLVQAYNAFLYRYAMRWVALGPTLRARLPDPRSINPDMYAMVKMTMDNYVSSLREEGKAVADIADKAARFTIGAGALVVAGLLLWTFGGRR